MTAILALNIWLFQHGALSSTVFVGCMLFAFNLLRRLNSSIKNRYAAIMQAALNRVNEVFNERELEDTGTESLPQTADTEITFKNVSFDYGDKEVLHNLSFSIEQGQMAAFVGQSGGGKSTIMNILARFWDISKGEILFTGKNIKELPLTVLMDHISMVFQRVYLFEDTIANNIAMGRPHADREAVIEAAKKRSVMILSCGFRTDSIPLSVKAAPLFRAEKPSVFRLHGVFSKMRRSSSWMKRPRVSMPITSRQYRSLE